MQQIKHVEIDPHVYGHLQYTEVALQIGGETVFFFFPINDAQMDFNIEKK